MSGVGLIGLAVFAVGVLGSIALHEVGHLVPAKKFGVRVTQYMIGFGPTVWSRVRGETEYGFKGIPLGGYIRMVGMFPPRRTREGELVHSATTTGPIQSLIEDARRTSSEEIAAGEEHRAFYQLSVPKKLVVMLGGPTMNLFLAAVLYGVALVLLGVPQLTTTVDQVAECVPASVVDECTPQDPRSPAAEAGVQAGDQIVAVDGVGYGDWQSVVDDVRGRSGEQVTLTVERDGRSIDLPMTVASSTIPSGTCADETTTVGFVGVSPGIAQVREPVTAVPERMWEFVSRSAVAVAAIPKKMVCVWNAAFNGSERDPTGPVSVVGVGRFSVQVGEDEADWSWKLANWLTLLAGLNMALFLFNLIPLLPLDGGHVAGALYEGARRQIAKLRGRPDPGPVDVARMLPVAYTVAFLLIGMSVLLIYADLVNPITLN
ncbi:MAG TPA: M50 family metallopeptidase [Actinomycetes bacterium]|nr:M50 family metallopeptidase [Actinomycetes bacterium]